MDPRDRTFYDTCFDIEMEALADCAAANPDSLTFPPPPDQRRKMRYQLILTHRLLREFKKVEAQLENKFGPTWALVLEYLGGFRMGLKVSL